ncbi:MAG: FtsQ-type POTRA domain-containing protein [Acidobacteria bacterium]|nr:FtsQ-type POTRA domain-containing protein [Acidobacteriota bacterium]
MAARTRKTTLKNKSAAVAPKRRRTTKAPTRRKNAADGNLVNFLVPLFLISCILFCLGLLGFMGYRTVTASEFFDVRKIDVRGTTHASKSDIEKIVSNQTEKLGVWNADLKDIKERVERLDFVKSAAVSRVLPDGLRVNVIERVPKAVVRLGGGDFWADDEGTLIAPVAKGEAVPPFVMRGWDETKTDKALKDNQARVKTYQKMIDEWKTFDLDKRVKSVDMTDLSKPKAIVEDSGETIEIVLAKDTFGKKLQVALENVAGKGKQVGGIDVSEVQPRFTFR